jgi:glyoxylase-like metal-dependent hydrolase (beta-lactamase superfamily II)
MNLIDTRTKKTILIALICLNLMQLPAVNGAQFKKNDSIDEYQISVDIIRFEEVIPLNIDPAFFEQNGVDPFDEGSYYKANVYGIDIGEGVILIDCGEELLAQNLSKSVRKAFKKPVLAIYLTHGHADHAGAGSYFQSKGVPVYAPLYDVPILSSGASVPGMNIPDEFTYEPYQPEFIYEYSDLAQGFSYVPTPGHTMGSVSLMYQSEHGVYLFTGDTVMEMPGTDPFDQSFTLSMFTAHNNWLMDQDPAYPEFMYWWQFSLGTLGSTVSYVDTVCPGHDAPYESAYALGYIKFTRAILNSFSYPLMP